MKKLSIITICYNEPNLVRTCESITNQSWQDFEWVVIDGGSDKKTLDEFSRYRNRIDVFVSEKDSGIYNACNKGIKLAGGEYINFLNAGDMYSSKDVLKNIFSDNQYEADILYGTQNQIIDGKVCLSNPKNKLPDSLDSSFWINSNLPTPSMFIKSNLFKTYGGFDESYKIAADYDKWVLFYKKNIKFLPLNMTVADFDIGGISTSKEHDKLHQEERQKIIHSYFTPDQIETAQNMCRKHSLLERIFSVKNSFNNKYKIITFLGLRFKIQRDLNVS